jgi:hypothetical protein
MDLGQIIAEIALSYVGEKEITPNKGFANPELDKKMRAVGFYTGAPWCGFGNKLIYDEAGASTELCSGSSRSIIQRATLAGNWHAEPVQGAIVVWATFKNGKRQTTGHIGTVTKVDGDKYNTVEGNTTDKGGREGVMFAERFRSLRPEVWKVNDGLRLMGFVYPEPA